VFSPAVVSFHREFASVQLIGMESCSGSHFQSNKTDYIDAEAIAEAVQRPRMRFVPIKTEDQLDLQALHRVREQYPKADVM
jgi:transposase